MCSRNNIAMMSDSSGSVIERYTYDPYGKMTIRDNVGNVLAASTIDNAYLYSSRRYDDATGLYYYRNRMYSPTLGRFMQRDPEGYGDGMNVYAYVQLNPINFLDPYGLDRQSGRYVYARGIWTTDTNVTAKLGQAVSIEVYNPNVLGTTLSIEPNAGPVQEMILLPQQRHTFDFYQFGSEPTNWSFYISTVSDAFVVQYSIDSTWVPGMPPNE